MAVVRTLRRILTAASLAAATTGAAFATAGPADAASVLYVATTGANAGTCTQAAPCATVTYALTKAAAGDTINVLPGTYTDSPILNKAITINGTANGVVFQGSATAYAMAVVAAGSQTLNRLTLTGGHYATGGGLFLYAGTVTANNVAITGNVGANGAGAYVFTGSLTMNGGSVSGNTATATGANQGWGGGIYEYAGTTVTLTGTTVSGNTADGAGKAFGYGGGIIAGGTTVLSGATFSGNTATGPSNTALGGAAYLSGSGFTATNTTFKDNRAPLGGAIASAKPITLVKSTLSNNQALAGGAIYATAAVDITGGTINGNKATANYGGGLYATSATNPAGPVAVDIGGTVLTTNDAVSGGGAIATTGTVTTTIHDNATLAGNTSVNGAAISNAGTLVVTDSKINGNNASYQGGGVFNGSATATDTPTANLTGTQFTGNTAAFGGGAISNYTNATTDLSGGTLRGNSAYAGGAVVNAATMTIDGSTLAQNVATSAGGGAIFTSSKMTVTGSTLDANTAASTSGTTTGLGGAIYNGGNTANGVSQLTVKRSTLSNNQGYAGSAISSYSTGAATSQTSVSDSTVTGNQATSTSGALLAIGGRMSLARTTLTQNTAAQGGYSVLATSNVTVGVAGSIIYGNGGNACNAAATNGGSNLVGPGTTACSLGAAGADPKLGALADNGGPTKTQLPAPASPALDRIAAGTTAGTSDAVTGNPVELCSGTDQRGTARPQGAKCDIGAVEVAQTVPAVTGPAHLDVTVGAATDATTYTAAGSPLPTLSAAGLPAGLKLVDNGDGTATLSGTPTGPGGEVTATITGTNEAGAGSESVTIAVHQAPTLTGPSSDTFTVGQAGGPDVFTQSGGYPAATLSIGSTGSDLPDGVTFTPGSQGDTGTGTIAGTPAAGSGGDYRITVEGSNGTGPDATWPFHLVVDEAPSLTGPAAATYTAGTQGSTDLTVGGFPAPTLSATGLPAGLAATPHGIAGAPAAGSGGEYDATVTASNGIGSDASHHVHLTVDEAPAIAGPTEVRLVTGRSASRAASVVFTATGYPVATLTESGDLPADVSFADNGHGGASLIGTPSATGVYHVTIKASNGIGRDASYDVTITVVPPVSITTTQLPGASVGEAYSAMVVADGGSLPQTFSVGSGTLPAGLALGSDGHLSGTPTGDAGTSTFTVKVADADGDTATRQLSIVVAKGGTAITAKPVTLTVGLLKVTTTVSAQLSGGLPPTAIAGQTITFRAGKTVVCTGVTGADGVATCQLTFLGLLNTLLGLGVTATYDGNAKWNGSTAPVPLL